MLAISDSEFFPSKYSRFEDKECYLTMMYFRNGDRLSDFLSEKLSLDTKGLMRRIADALVFFHSRNVVFGDLNPSTILVWEDYANMTFRINLFDFDIDVAGMEDTKEYQLSTETINPFRSPEVFRQEFFDFTADVYSAGMIFLYMYLIFEIN